MLGRPESTSAGKSGDIRMAFHPSIRSAAAAAAVLVGGTLVLRHPLRTEAELPVLLPVTATADGSRWL